LLLLLINGRVPTYMTHKNRRECGALNYICVVLYIKCGTAVQVLFFRKIQDNLRGVLLAISFNHV
jgi:hypothetical protein